MRGLAAMVPVVGLIVQGCGPMACTEMGGINGIDVEIPAALHVESGSVAFEVCDEDGCASAIERLGRIPGEKQPSGRRFLATFEDLGRRFGPGPVAVTVELKDSTGRTVAVSERNVEMKRYYPNGKRCDGDGYVNGYLTMRAADRT